MSVQSRRYLKIQVFVGGNLETGVGSWSLFAHVPSKQVYKNIEGLFKLPLRRVIVSGA